MDTARTIDLNCDLGEGYGHDAALMAWITSANIACGAHAGDLETMQATVKLAVDHGVALGAHPGFADREHFGRREGAVAPSEVRRLVAGQILDLQTVAARHGARLAHVKPHGALYHLTARDPVLARAIAEAVRDVDPGLVLFGLAGSALIQAGRACGLRAANEVFADRTYRADGSLAPRTQPDALIHEPSTSVAQVLRMVREGKVRASNGSDVPVVADTVCLHGDGPEAVTFARHLRLALEAAGLRVQPFATGCAMG